MLCFGERQNFNIQKPCIAQKLHIKHKTCLKSQRRSRNLGISFWKPWVALKENYKGFLSPYQSVSLLNWNMVEKPTWRSLGSCKTCQKKAKTLKMSKNFMWEKDREKKITFMWNYSTQFTSGGNRPSKWYVNQLIATDVCTVGNFGIIKGLDSLSIFLSSPP